jgi:endoglucanase
MKKFFLLIIILAIASTAYCENWIRVNQVGYLCKDVKVAVMLMQKSQQIKSFKVTNIATGKTIKLKTVSNCGAQSPFAATARLDFSVVTAPGTYRITAGSTVSPDFRIGDSCYYGLQELPLYYMRQQRCGYNPFLRDSCHTHDGRLVLSGALDGTKVDATGGWHDASDYLQYVTTSANAVFDMLAAYKFTRNIWADKFDSAGNEGSNGIPDILDEARWGLDWLLKMNPNDSTFYNQVADDRDHRMATLPANDSVDYGWGKACERPVYPCCGHPYGLKGHLNRSTGLASSVAKFSSAFSFGADVFSRFDTAYSSLLSRKAEVAYRVAKAHPGACQTAPCVSPYFYEEDNWTDDMELAAIMLYGNSRSATSDKQYLADAIAYGRQEPVTPWMGADTARHYQWYPFMNFGHVFTSIITDSCKDGEFASYLRTGLQRVADRAKGNAFLHGIPFIWCSNNLTVAFVTQAIAYRELTGDTAYKEIETAMRDWLFGVNPWGKCMIIGIQGTDFPLDPHSALSNLKHYPITGGLVDGPVYTAIFKSLRGVHLRNADKYAQFQSPTCVYHDDYSDYSTNEPTMDGTAATTFMFSRLASPKNQ